MFDDINKMTINTKWFLLQIRDLFMIKLHYKKSWLFKRFNLTKVFTLTKKDVHFD